MMRGIIFVMLVVSHRFWWLSYMPCFLRLYDVFAHFLGRSSSSREIGAILFFSSLAYLLSFASFLSIFIALLFLWLPPSSSFLSHLTRLFHFFVTREHMRLPR
jgi:hypothetical protein